jgi:glycosyltransferase involved in cell wall biosynthesis
MAKTVSVIIPTYNREKLLLEAVDSVLQQSYDDYEIIVLDDGSTDGTQNAISNYSPKVTYIKQENRGVNAARNIAIQHARGEYIALLDSDDLWLPGKLALQIKLLELFQDVGFVYSDFYILKPNGEKLPAGIRTWHHSHHDWRTFFSEAYTLEDLGIDHSLDFAPVDLNVYVGDIYAQSLFEPYVLPSCAVIRRAKLDSNAMFVEDDSICGDWDFFTRFSHKHGCIYIDRETTLNRSHEDDVRLTRTDKKIQLAHRIDLINRIWKSDNEFVMANAKQIGVLEAQFLFQLSLLHLLDGDNGGAQTYYSKFLTVRQYASFKERWILFGAARIPAASSILRTIRNLKRIVSH